MILKNCLIFLKNSDEKIDFDNLKKYIYNYLKHGKLSDYDIKIKMYFVTMHIGQHCVVYGFMKMWKNFNRM